MLGTLPSAVDARLQELGVGMTSTRPHPLYSVSKCTNKLVALLEPGDPPILLVDNDVCLLGDVSDLSGRNVRASLASAERLHDAHWAHIAAATGREPLSAEWVPLNREFRAKWKGRRPRASQKLYLNGGVVWVNSPVAFGSGWAAAVDAIARAFDGHPLDRVAVRGSDQAGLAIAVAEHGGFDLLPIAYNYRPVCFALGLEEPKIVHLNKFGDKEPLPFSRQMPFSRTLSAFWDRRIIQHIVRRGGGVSGGRQVETSERAKLLDEAMTIRDRLLRLVADAGLDSFTFHPGEI